MLNRRLADLVMVLHALIAVFFLFGSVAARFELWIGLIHIPLAVWVCSAYIMGWTCPLTPLENHYRKAAGEQGYEGSFVEHYLGRLFGFNAGDKDVRVVTKGERKTQIFLGIWFAIINLVMYSVMLPDYHDAIWSPAVKPPE